MKSKMELKKIRDREYSRKYYYLHKEEIKARRDAKKANKKGWITLPTPKNEVLMQTPKIQDIYVYDFYSKQLERIINVLWWICFAISFVGVAVLFK